jgi:hypothetical protein
MMCITVRFPPIRNVSRQGLLPTHYGHQEAGVIIAPSRAIRLQVHRLRMSGFSTCYFARDMGPAVGMQPRNGARRIDGDAFRPVVDILAYSLLFRVEISSATFPQCPSISAPREPTHQRDGLPAARLRRSRLVASVSERWSPPCQHPPSGSGRTLEAQATKRRDRLLPRSPLARAYPANLSFPATADTGAVPVFVGRKWRARKDSNL